MNQTITNEATVLGALQLFLEEHYAEAIEELRDQQQEQTSLSVDFTRLLQFNPALGMRVLETPTRTLPLFDQALRSIQRHPTLTTVRIHGLPSHPLLALHRMPSSQDAGRLLSISGTVIRSGMVKMMETSRQYRCGKCQGYFSVLADVEQYNHIPRPTRCLAPGADFCDSTAFHPSAEQAQQNCVDYQELKIQEQVGRLALGTIPRTTAVILEGGLVDVAKSGDSVTVTGTVIRRWRPVTRDERPDISLAVRANHVTVHGAGGCGPGASETAEELRQGFRSYWDRHRQGRTQMRARDLLVASVCPQVYGLFYVKLAVLLVAIGGVARTDRSQSQSGLRIRGEAHLLLVGDPGTAKSQFLKYASRLVPRSVLTTGIGSTSAGLTVTAVRDGGEWALEAGALVLADRGICCIDEFGSIREAEKSTILEAMEQQSISVAKAGIVCRLNSRCAVLAAMNPKGQYDPHASLSVNTALSSPLLSRFDLIMVLLDASDARWDERVAAFLLADGSPETHGSESGRLWSFDRLQAYVAHVKSSIAPVSTEESERILTRYYQLQRQRDQQNASRTTIRLLESLIRLSQAHARLMFRDKVQRMDAVMAVVLMETTMASAALLGSTDCLHTVLPLDSDLFYAKLETQVLQALQLPHTI